MEIMQRGWNVQSWEKLRAARIIELVFGFIVGCAYGVISWIYHRQKHSA